MAIQQNDPVVQNALGGGKALSVVKSFEGMGAGMPGFTVQSAPPDTSGDIGPNHYVQIVNSSTTIFDRNGVRLLGPFATNTLFNGLGGSCQNTNDGDGVVRYDRFADRWVISQFAVNGGNGPFFQCVAVSTSPDPTGTYNRYAFSFNGFNDYPKVGLWPDGYYFTFNIFNGNTFAGARVCAFDRDRMIAGLSATAQCFNTSNQIGGLLASDVDGPTLPPAGSPNFLLALNTTTTLAYFKMHVDFANPANATFTGPINVPVAAFTPLCNGGTCVVQPGTTVRLDSLADRLMNRLVYRNFGTHEALLVTHAVNPGVGGGVRFYELRSPNAATPTVFQQGTYAPDSAFRWMSSAVFDAAGNIAIAFAISSSGISPSIRATGRLTTDPLGTMGQGEVSIVAGAGAQINNLTRWGDYSSLNVDPLCETVQLAPPQACKMWSVLEYTATNGAFNWRTRVGVTQFVSFNMMPNPTAQTVAAGASTTYVIDTAPVSNTADTISLSVSGLPTGVTGTFNPASVTAGDSSTLTVNVAANALSSTNQLAITGTAESVTRTVNVTLIITDSNQPPTISITSPVNGSSVSGSIAVAANAADPDGAVASIRFDLPDVTSVNDTVAPFATTFDSTRVQDGDGHMVRATATDNKGATATANVTVTVANGSGCIDGTFTSTDVPKNIPDNNSTGVTSNLAITGNGIVATLQLSLNITHTFRGDLVVTLIAPGGTQFIVSNRAGGSIDNLIIDNLTIASFNDQTATGTWRLRIQDLASVDIGRLNSWSLRIAGNCTPTVRWSGAATQNLPTIDNGTACTSLTVTTIGGDSLAAKLDISGRHDFCSSLRGTVAHNGTTVTAFPVGTFAAGACTFSFANRAVPGLSGDSSGTWTLCIFDTDAFGDTGVLNTGAVHD